MPLAGIFHMCHVAEEMIWKATQLTCQRRVDGLSPDRGLDRLYVDTSGDTPVIYLRPPVKGLILNFAGRVNIEPTENAIKIGSASETDLYMSGSGFTWAPLNGSVVQCSDKV